MDGAGHIEALSLSFTVGTGAGILLFSHLPGSIPGAAASAVLLLMGVPLLLRKRICLWTEGRLQFLLPLLFLATGLFCGITASFEGVSTLSPLTVLSEEAAGGLRQRIDALGFSSPETAALLKALLTGDRSTLSKGTVAAFRGSGASHILALSGLHIGIIYLLLDHLTRPLGRFPLSRILRWSLVVLASGFFTLMTGAAPSIVRAFLFILIRESLLLSGRSAPGERVLCLALFFQLVLSPLSIRSVGFQLSYLAVAGIFLLYPTLESWYPAGICHDPLRWIWKSAALSISCQVTTAPLAWYRFHAFPRHFLLTNLLALPLTSLLMGLSLLTLAWSAVAPCPGLLVRATEAAATALIHCLEIISGM